MLQREIVVAIATVTMAMLSWFIIYLSCRLVYFSLGMFSFVETHCEKNNYISYFMFYCKVLAIFVYKQFHVIKIYYCLAIPLQRKQKNCILYKKLQIFNNFTFKSRRVVAKTPVTALSMSTTKCYLGGCLQ